MKDVSIVANFLSPKQNIHRYKAFPQWTENLNRAKLGDKPKLTADALMGDSEQNGSMFSAI